MKSRRRLLAGVLLITVLVLPGCASNSAMSQVSNLAGLAGVNPNLSTFLGLAQTAGLEGLLKGKNPLTMLVPSNDAFAALGAEALSTLSNPENKDKLVNLLKGNMISGSMPLDALAKGGATNLLGAPLDIGQAKNGHLTVNGAEVTESLKGSNGFIHVVDKVNLPQ
ncbi:MAG: fasciclin domain-containing protein [Candidatus Eiseniibacteriota bacterium]